MRRRARSILAIAGAALFATACASTNATPPDAKPATMTSGSIGGAPIRSFHRPRSIDVIPSLTWTSFRGGEGVIGGTATTGGIGTGFEDEGGFGLALNAFLTRNVSGELGASLVQPATDFSPTRGALGQLVGSRMRIVPLTAALQYHFVPDRTVDPYIGVGGAYVMMDAVDAFGGAAGIQDIEFDDKAGLLMNAGVSIGLGGNVGVNFDAKYLSITSEGRAAFTNGTFGGRGELDVNPLILSVGVRFGF